MEGERRGDRLGRRVEMDLDMVKAFTEKLGDMFGSKELQRSFPFSGFLCRFCDIRHLMVPQTSELELLGLAADC